jgi:hypothetical protein
LEDGFRILSPKKIINENPKCDQKSEKRAAQNPTPQHEKVSFQLDIRGIKLKIYSFESFL